MSATDAPYPYQGDLVTLTLPDGRRVLATVAAVTPDGAQLELDPDAGSVAEELHEVRGELEFATTDGMWRVGGGLTSATGDEGAQLGFSVSGMPELVQRRQFVRMDVQTKVSLFPRGGERLRAETVNASAGGLLLGGAPALELGEEMRFALFLAGERSITGSCRVVRVQDGGLCAVRFVSLARQTQHRLIRYLFEAQQQQSRPQQPTPRVLLERAVHLQESGDSDAAQAAYRDVIAASDPELAARAAVNLGFLLIELADRDGARAAFERALELGEPSVRPLAHAGLQAAGSSSAQSG